MDEVGHESSPHHDHTTGSGLRKRREGSGSEGVGTADVNQKGSLTTPKDDWTTDKTDKILHAGLLNGVVLDEEVFLPKCNLDVLPRKGISMRSGWAVLLWVVGAVGSWTGVGYALWLSWKDSSAAHVHLQHAMWLSQIGLLCLSLACDSCRKLFVMGTMIVLLPAVLLDFRGLDFEPTITLMHIISSIHYHYVQDMDNPRGVAKTHETSMILDYFWAHLDICSCFVYLSGITSRRLRSLVYMTFVYGLLALLTSKDRKNRQKRLGLLVFGGGSLLILVGYATATATEAPSVQWSGLAMASVLFGFASYNFFILQERHPNMYWLHHGLWHITGNATLLSMLHLRVLHG